MKPLLPQHAKRPDKRRKQLAERKEKYSYDYSWPPGVATAKETYITNTPGPSYIAQLGEISATLTANHAAMDVGTVKDKDKEGFLGRLAERFHHDRREHLARDFLSHIEEWSGSASKEPPASLADYEAYFAVIDAPPVVDFLNEEPGRGDAAFAWQRLAGPNPMVIERISAIPEHFAVTAADCASMLGEGDDLSTALSEGRVFLADYKLLDGVPGGNTDGRQKYMTAPLALFAQTRSRGFMPLAIQLHQAPRDDTPLFVPDGSWRWRMARTFVQVADANLHQAIAHLGTTHLIIEAVALASYRNLAEVHPVWKLLEGHFYGTHFINHMAKTSLIAPGGLVDQIMGGAIESTAAAVHAGIQAFDLQQSAPHKALGARGLMDRTALPVFPYRDDALPVWDALYAYTTRYVHLYYTSDDDVKGDTEVAAMLAELGSPTGGRLQHIRPVTTRGELAELLANIIFIATAQHAAVNFTQFPYQGWVANMPGAAWGTPPTKDTPDTEAAFRQRLPPTDMMLAAADAVYQLSNIRDNTLGDYGLFARSDRRVKPLVTELQERLERVEAQAVARDTTRPITYPYLRPSQIPNSIHI